MAFPHFLFQLKLNKHLPLLFRYKMSNRCQFPLKQCQFLSNFHHQSFKLLQYQYNNPLYPFLFANFLCLCQLGKFLR